MSDDAKAAEVLALLSENLKRNRDMVRRGKPPRNVSHAEIVTDSLDHAVRKLMGERAALGEIVR